MTQSRMSTSPIFKLMKEKNTEELVFKQDSETSLQFILIKHSMLMNKRVNGGIRMAGYRTVQEALEDGINLAEAMTIKNILYDLPWGGGKAVILGQPKKTKRFLHKIGEFVESFNGDFQTTIDMGLTERDAEIISERTQYIDSLDPDFKKGCLGPSATGTGIGVVEGITVAANKVFGSPSLKGKKIAVQGLGRVGGTVARLLLHSGATVIGTDKDKVIAERYRKMGVKIVNPKNIYSQNCDIFSPCARGGILNSETLNKMNYKIIAGGANNQLANDRMMAEIAQKGVLYVPDFVINGGGMLQSQCEYDRKTIEFSHNYVKKRVAQMVRYILAKAEKNRKPPFEVAKNIVDDKIRKLQRRRTLKTNLY